MHDYKIEDTILLLDASRSMLRKDFKPNRLLVELQTAKNFIINKLSKDLKDRISILTFGESPKKLISFSYDGNKLINSLKKVQISGNGFLHEGLAFALQILIEEMRKIGGKVPRILIISDNKIQINPIKLEKVINIAKGLNIYIDVCQLGMTQDHQLNVLERLTKITWGEFGFFNNSKELINAAKKFASKKELKDDVDYFSPDKKDKISPLISDIALPLRRPTVLEIRLMMNRKERSKDKCQICHSVKAPVTNADFFSEGRYCPSCDRPMHLSCAAMWARKTEYTENVFRCPFCFFLLEIPKSVTKLVEERTEGTQKIKIIDNGSIEHTKMIKVPQENISEINQSCSYCHSIFLGDFNVYQCRKCHSYYHEPCLEKMINELKACRYCGAKIIND
ncbi:MAG: VWA domain-containing protein [Promethearchaeota archaeon]